MVGGVAGALVASGASSGSENPGPVDFVPLDEAAARTKIEELQLQLAGSEIEAVSPSTRQFGLGSR
jgi:hypothetical protein